MSRPFWFAAVTGTLLTARLVNAWADDRTEALAFVAVLIWSLFALGLIDVYRTRKS